MLFLYRGSGQQKLAPRGGASCAGTWGIKQIQFSHGSGVRSSPLLMVSYAATVAIQIAQLLQITTTIEGANH